MELESQIIHWIGEGISNNAPMKPSPIIPLESLERHLPNQRKTQNRDLTDSMVHSFKMFDRATISRAIRQLRLRGLVEIIEKQHKNLGEPVQYVTLSQDGLNELARLRHTSKR